MARRWRIRHKLMVGLGLVIAIMALLLGGTQAVCRFQVKKDGEPTTVALEQAQCTLVVVPTLMKDGRIIARQVRAYFDSGAYTRLSSYAVVKCAAHIPGPYTIPNVHADVYCVYTNRVPATAMRGFGVTAFDFGMFGPTLAATIDNMRRFRDEVVVKVRS